MDKRKAIASHYTATSTGTWDGPANEARLSNDAGAATYRKAYAWRDPEGDADAKASYKFIHHEVAADGAVGAANMKACSATIAVLNGGRGGTTIPEADHEGVHAHVATHMMDAEMEPPELKVAAHSRVEYRIVPLSRIETRAAEDGSPIIAGYAAIFNKLSEPMWGFREQIAPGAFKKTLREADVRALFNHDVSHVLGRSKNRTLTLAEDLEGLAVQIQPPATTWAQDLMTSMQRGDIDQMSFAFEMIKESWANENGQDIRTLHEVQLYDVSVVTYPAYPQTSASVRSILETWNSYRPTVPSRDAHTDDAEHEPGLAAHSERQRQRRIAAARWLFLADITHKHHEVGK